MTTFKEMLEKAKANNIPPVTKSSSISTPLQTTAPTNNGKTNFAKMFGAQKPVTAKPFVAKDILRGTGITKKLATSQEKAIEKIKAGDSELSAADVTEIIKKEQDELTNEIYTKQEVIDEIVLDPSQQAAIDGLRSEMYGVLIGAAGTGKTTIEKILVEELEESVDEINLNNARTKIDKNAAPDMHAAICFCAFTGRAVQQMKRALPKKYHPLCNTIHSTLGYAPTFEVREKEDGSFKEVMIFRPTFTKYNKLPFKICVIDEAGMVPIYLWNELIDALPEDARIMLIGDINQLPPVQGRSVLGFAMQNWPTFALEKIHRQAEGNPIIQNAHNILNGFFPKHNGTKFAMKQISDGSTAVLREVIAVIKMLHQRELFDPFRDALIVPQNKGPIGQEYLNEHLVHYFNPEKKDEMGNVLNKRTIINAGIKTCIFAVGDKVMLLENDNERGLTNGMIGVVTKISINGMFKGQRMSAQISEMMVDQTEVDFSDLTNEFALEMETEKTDKEDAKESERQASHILTVRFGGADDGLEIEFATAGQYRKVMLAYASTCHKSQGGEYPTVVIVCHSANIKMLCREWLYTAVTRARERVILLFNDRGLAQAINIQRIKGRTLEEKAKQFLALQQRGPDEVSLPILHDPRKVGLQ